MKMSSLVLISRAKSCLGVIVAASMALIALPTGGKAQEAIELTQVLKVSDPGFTVSYPDSWSLAPQQFVNSYKLINVASDRQDLDTHTARVKTMAEARRDHADALSQLSQAADGMGASSDELISIGGWPALQTTRLETRQQPSQGPQFADRKVLTINTSVAAGSFLIYLHASLPSEATPSLIAEALAIAGSLVTDAAADSAQTNAELEQLRQGRANSTSESLSLSSGALAGASGEEEGPGAVQTPPSTFNQRIFFTQFGELEIAVSPDGQNVIVGRQSAWAASNDGGLTFPGTLSGSIAAFDGGDPSLAYGVSGAFYYAGIDRNCHNSAYLTPPAMGPTGVDCTGIARSTDNGANFPINTTNPAVVCPRATTAGDCFPDQEHIAADRVNAAPGGGDQVYSTWRNFDPANFDGGGLVCSQDSGVNWTAPIDLGTNARFSRIAVGQDGFVYVTGYGGGNYRLWKFSSCANGLVLQAAAGFPVVVLARDPVDCPFAGHDRCDQNPSSQTVAVDDTNPNHIYFSVADADGTANRDATILVSDSIDGGVTWRPTVQANVAFPGPRIMPWMCTVGGDAYVTWFDRRAAPPCPNGNCVGIQNDLTDFYAGRVGLDEGGNLVAKGEFKISEAAHPWCGPTNTAWPAPTRQAVNPAPGASEGCSLQPQLGGQCCIDVAPLDQACDAGTATGIVCDVGDDNPGTRCLAGQVCLGGGGRPRYGDYNGSACAAGRLFAAWPGSTSPPGVPPANAGEGILFDAFLVGAVPLISVPADIDFGTVCGNGSFDATLQVCNTGNENLLVKSIASSDAQFNATAPNSGFPVQISPDFCFPFEVTFTPTSSGAQGATLTLSTNDPAFPSVDVNAMGTVGEPDINVSIANSGDFGEVCTGDLQDLDLVLLNQGLCALTINTISSSDPIQFELPTNTQYPIILSAGENFTVPVRFSPTTCGSQESAQISIASDSPSESPLVVGVSGTVPCPDINVAIADSGDFGEVCKGDFADLDLTLFNQGRCDLTISALDLLPDPDSFELPADLQFPLILSHDADFTVPLRYAPDECFFGKEERTLRITSDDPNDPTLEVGLKGKSPCPDLVIDPTSLTELYAYPTTVVDSSGTLGCFEDRTAILRNAGTCPLIISAITATGESGNAADFAVIAPTQFPILLPPGEETLEVNVRFTPQADTNPLAPSEVTGLLTVVSDDPDFPHEAGLCGESSAQSGVRVLVTDVSSGTPLPVAEVDQLVISSQGKNTRTNLRFTDHPVSMAMVCNNPIVWHVDQETLSSTETSGSNPRSSYEAKAKEGLLMSVESFSLGQCELKEFQLQLQDGSSDTCLLLPKGASCSDAGECCSGKCKGPAGGRSCK